MFEKDEVIGVTKKRASARNSTQHNGKFHANGTGHVASWKLSQSMHHLERSIVMGVPQNGWLLLGKQPLKWMRTGGTTISGNPHLGLHVPIWSTVFVCDCLSTTSWLKQVRFFQTSSLETAFCWVCFCKLSIFSYPKLGSYSEPIILSWIHDEICQWEVPVVYHHFLRGFHNESITSWCCYLCSFTSWTVDHRHLEWLKIPI